MTTEMLLYTSFVIYIIIMILGYIFKINWLYMIAGLIWFVPMSQIENTWITLVSVVMILAHALIAFFTKEESGDF